MHNLFEGFARIYFLAATIVLMLLAAVLFLGAIWSVLGAAMTHGDPVGEVLDSIGLIIIGFAVVELTKFIAEEEIIRRRELRSALESRRSLTKFTTIIVIAGSLEALVMTFKTSRDNIPEAIYPAALFMAVMLALVALGAYQWLSSKVEPSPKTPDAVRRDDGPRV